MELKKLLKWLENQLKDRKKEDEKLRKLPSSFQRDKALLQCLTEESVLLDVKLFVLKNFK